MDFKMSKFDIDRIACLMYRDIAAYIDDQRKQSSDCDAAARKEETVLGYTYTVTCSGFQGERLDVKIPGKQLLGEDAYDHLVKFTNIQLGIYPSFVKGQRGIDAVNLKAMAEGVTVIGG